MTKLNEIKTELRRIDIYHYLDKPMFIEKQTLCEDPEPDEHGTIHTDVTYIIELSGHAIDMCAEGAEQLHKALGQLLGKSGDRQ